MRLYVWRFPRTVPAAKSLGGPWFVSDETADEVYSAHTTHAEAFADAWARTHPKVAFVPIDSDTYRVVGAMPRSAVTGRYKASSQS